VILLDEIEKAHHDVFNILLQILDDGRLTDSHGRTVNFKNTIVIMTSNIGSPVLLEGIGEDGQIKEAARREVMDELRRSFRPEFLNRLDDVVLFKPLTLEEISRIVDIQMTELRERLGEQRIDLKVAEGARNLLAREGYSPVYGARPLKRLIQTRVETPIARLVVAATVKAGQVLLVGVKKGDLEIQVEKEALPQEKKGA
jgi:ATP-dependent Clp protease ATP-binding subunit ClpB